jgi:hypothetical protein
MLHSTFFSFHILWTRVYSEGLFPSLDENLAVDPWDGPYNPYRRRSEERSWYDPLHVGENGHTITAYAESQTDSQKESSINAMHCRPPSGSICRAGLILRPTEGRGKSGEETLPATLATARTRPVNRPNLTLRL